MPRGKPANQPTVKSEQQRLMWGLSGADILPTVESWDPKTEPLIEAMLAVVASGATLVIRAGSGGRAIGLSIWEGDQRPPAKWVYDSEELDEWAAMVNTIAQVRRASATD